MLVYPPMLKILITGSNGLLGQKLLSTLKNRRDASVIATSAHPNRFPVSGHYAFELFDITQKNQAAACLARHQPDTLIHTAAITNVDFCENHKEECWKVNVEGTESLIRECEKYKTHFIHLSTDFVFDGKCGPYREEDTPNPVNYYGQSKLASEKIVRESETPWAILRTILVYGFVPHMPRPNIVLFVKNSLEKKQPLRMVTDHYRMPTLAEDLAEACLQTAERTAQGLFHVSGNEMVSIYEFSKIIAGELGFDPSLIQAMDSSLLNAAAKRPGKTGFILDKARKILRYEPHSLQKGLALIKEQMAKTAPGKD